MAATTSKRPAKRLAQVHPGDVLRDVLIPGVQESGISKILLAQTEMTGIPLPPGMSITPLPPLGKPVVPRTHITGRLASWPDRGMESWRHPSINFICSGEADIPVGNAIVHCPAGHAVLIPTGVPVGDGHGGHWYRENPENAHSEIFWLTLRPFGAEFHMCRTVGLRHESGWFEHCHTTGDRRLFPLIEDVIEEMQQRNSRWETVAGAHLLSLLCILQRQYDLATAANAFSPVGEEVDHEMGENAMVIQRALRFIEANLREPLTLQLIANAAYVSRARLAEVFKEVQGQTVWETVTEHRLKAAKTMLADTDLRVNDVARLSGFKCPSHFFARFAERTGMSPGEFRDNARHRKTD